jgi:cell pole-organizing protein PopZ
MATTTTPTRRTRFSRRIPDHVTDELVNVLSIPKIYEFNELFGLVYENLKKRNAVSGGEEMLRLRAYEKLQNLVGRNLVEKHMKTYRGLAGIKSAASVNQPKPMMSPIMAAAQAAVKAEEEAAAAAERAAAKAAASAAAKAARAAAAAAAAKTVAKKPAAAVKAKPLAKAASAKAPAKPTKVAPAKTAAKAKPAAPARKR